MALNVTLKTSLNQFIVNENMNDNNQDPDLNFFHESFSSSLDTDQIMYLQKILRVSLKVILKTLSLFYI